MLHNMKKILISSCLLGEPVRYNGTGATTTAPIILQWQQEDRLIPVCPEILAGLSTPRPPAEIKTTKNGQEVFDIMDNNITDLFILGAQKTLELVIKHNIKIAIMKARSPSCGNVQIYDGSFTNQLIPGAGITGSALLDHGCKVFNEEQLETAQHYFDSIG